MKKIIYVLALVPILYLFALENTTQNSVSQTQQTITDTPSNQVQNVVSQDTINENKSTQNNAPQVQTTFGLLREFYSKKKPLQGWVSSIGLKQIIGYGKGGGHY